MSKHTPGPWRYDGSRYVREVSTDGCIARIEEDDGHVNPRARKAYPAVANGNLIAAAPDLLEALHRLHAQCERMRLLGQPLSDAEKFAARTLAKAEGKK